MGHQIEWIKNRTRVEQKPAVVHPADDRRLRLAEPRGDVVRLELAVLDDDHAGWNLVNRKRAAADL